MLLHALIMELGVFIASVAQVFLKKSANNQHSSIFSEFLNPKVIVGYSMMFISTLCSIYALKQIPLSLAMLLDSTAYIFVCIHGYIFFKETISFQRATALFLILLGITFYALIG